MPRWPEQDARRRISEAQLLFALRLLVFLTCNICSLEPFEMATERLQSILSHVNPISSPLDKMSVIWTLNLAEKLN